MKTAALLIEDRDTALVVRTALECAGFGCESFAGAVPMMRALRRDEHAALFVDTQMDGVDCAELLAWCRNWLGADIAIVALGADDGLSVARHLDLGFDDFVAKPVRGAELLARLAAVQRRRRPAQAADSVSVAGCSIDRGASAIVYSSSRVPLTTRELALAQLLFENVGQLVTRTRLARDVWGQNLELSGRSIEQHIYQLRRKLKLCAGEAIALRGVYGSGYRIEAKGASNAREQSASRKDAADRLARARRASDIACQAIEQASA